MEGRNVIIAIALSLSVILFWEAFMTVPKKELQNNSTSQSKQFKEENDNNKDDSIAPSINEIKIPKSVSRNESIDSVQRIKINNEKIEGSISLKGGIIDDVSFKNYKQSLEKNDNVVFLNPKQTTDGYFVETGWTSIGNKIKVPNINSNWKVKGNNILSPDKPVILEWNNQEGLIFRKKINLDKKYLLILIKRFKIIQVKRFNYILMLK